MVGVAANIACLLSVLVQPYMPEVSKTIQGQLNAPQECNVIAESFVSFLPTGHKIGQVMSKFHWLKFTHTLTGRVFGPFTSQPIFSLQPKPLFNKIEGTLIAELKKKYAGQEQAKEKEKVSPGKKQNFLQMFAHFDCSLLVSISSAGHSLHDWFAVKKAEDSAASASTNAACANPAEAEKLMAAVSSQVRAKDASWSTHSVDILPVRNS